MFLSQQNSKNTFRLFVFILIIVEQNERVFLPLIGNNLPFLQNDTILDTNISREKIENHHQFLHQVRKLHKHFTMLLFL